MAKRGNPNLNKVKATEIVEEISPIINETIKEQEVKPKQEITPMWKPDLNRMIYIKNISRGKLIYKSKRQKLS